jgi:hypothetical protein
MQQDAQNYLRNDMYESYSRENSQKRRAGRPRGSTAANTKAKRVKESSAYQEKRIQDNSIRKSRRQLEQTQ